MRFAAIAVWSMAASLALAQDARDVPKFASKVEMVTVDAVVQDAQGRPVRGLTAADFTLLEDGKAQAIGSFEAIDVGETTGPWPSADQGPIATNARPRSTAATSYVLLIDDLSLAPSREDVVRTALDRFLDTSLRDGDEVIFATASRSAWWSARMPEGREDLRAVAARVRGRNLTDSAKDVVSEWEAYRISNFEGGGAGGLDGCCREQSASTRSAVAALTAASAPARGRATDESKVRRRRHPNRSARRRSGARTKLGAAAAACRAAANHREVNSQRGNPRSSAADKARRCSGAAAAHKPARARQQPNGGQARDA